MEIREPISARRARTGDLPLLAVARDRRGVAAQGRSGPLRAVGVFAALVAVSMVTRLAFLRAEFLNVDEAAHLVGSWELLRGGRLYVDFADNKPPLVYVFYAVAQLFFGKGLFAVRLFATVALLPLTALAASAFFGHDRRGQAAAVAFLLASATLLASDAHAVHCEHVMLLPLAWSLVVLRSPDAVRRKGALFAAGALVGLASLGKQPAAACLAVHAVAVVQWGRGDFNARAGRAAGSLAALAAGFLVPMLAAGAWFASRGSLDDVLFWTWRFNLGHVDNPMPAADKVVRILQMGSLVLPAALPLAVAAWAGNKGPGLGRPLLLPLFAAATLLPAWLGLRLFGHYFLPFLFALALAAGPFLGALGPRRGRHALAVAATFAFAVMTVVSCVVHDPRSRLADVSRLSYEQIGALVRGDHCARDGSLFVWGYAPTVYAYAGERPASRFVVPIDTLTGYLAGNDASLDGRLDTHGRINDAHWDRLMADLEGHRPEHFVDTAPGDLNRWGRFSLDRFPRLEAFVRRDYHVLAVVDGAVIYRSNACDAAAVLAKR